jgi:hypothetical protein
MTIDALVQKQLGRIIAFLHGEDLNNVRQTQYDPILRSAPAPGGRWTTDVWAPLEGRVVNFGLRVQYESGRRSRLRTVLRDPPQQKGRYDGSDDYSTVTEQVDQLVEVLDLQAVIERVSEPMRRVKER